MMKVCIVDDHPIVRAGVRHILAQIDHIQLSGEYSSIAHLYLNIRKKEWDVVILDLIFPKRQGLEAIGEIKKKCPQTKILIFSRCDESQYAFRALKEGADGFLSKERAADKLVEALELIVKGKRYINPDMAVELVSEMVDVSEGDRLAKLSNRELEVLRLIGLGFSTGDIAERTNLSSKTVSTYRARTMEKLGLKNTAALIRYSIEHNIL